MWGNGKMTKDRVQGNYIKMINLLNKEYGKIMSLSKIKISP